jgi:predicted ATPase/transcriptional regulator with XRE-family HTH domain
MSSPEAISAAVTFGDLLKQLRKRSGMTQAELAAAVGYSVPFISNLELDQRLPDVEVIMQRFVPALGLQEEPQLAVRLVELAATARGERPPQRTKSDAKIDRLHQEERPARLASLPLPPTELVGRDQEVKTLCNRLLAHNGRLLTLIGPPGIGKTRLALAVVEKLQAFYRDGIYVVPLAAISDAGLVAAAIIAELDIGGADERTSKVRLIDFLRRKEALLLLDNFEQVTAAARLVADLLAACPGLRILVTSRERLHLRAEQRYHVPSLDVDAALALFVQRSQAVAPDFALTPNNRHTLVQICQRLDCLPLAIELSAARVDLFTPDGLLARLHDQRLDLLNDGARDLPPHQRTLRNAIQRSYALLDDQERRLFRRLSVFAGGFEPKVLSGLGSDEWTLQSLVNKSLVQVKIHSERTHRFLLLETLREYAWEQLCAEGEAAVTQRCHAEIYLRLAEEAATHLRDAAQGIWIEQLEEEHANLRAALAFTLAAGDQETAIRLGIALWRFWNIRGYYEEGGRWLERLLAQADQPAQRATLLYARGMLARMRGDVALAIDSLTASLALFREQEDLRGTASALRGLAFVHYLRHDNAGARPLLDEALALFHRLDDLEGVAVTLDNLSYISNDHEEKRRLSEESLALRRRSGNLRGITMSLVGLAENAIYRGEYATARVYMQEHLQINQELGNHNGIANAIYTLGHIALGAGDPVTARSYYEQCIQLCQARGNRILLPGAMQGKAVTLLLNGEPSGVTALLEEALLIYREQGALFGAAEVLVVFAKLAVVQGLAERGLTLAGAVAANCIGLSDRLYPLPLAEFERTQSTAREMLGPQAAARAWGAGQAMSLEQAMDYALAKAPA